ncbi:MAG TPA: cystathionine beta-synthase [Bryobacteraceae bacterium]|nr:cystathionine beta-synthase [Bryobacteraceae bacterium]
MHPQADVLSLIGNTPVVELKEFDSGPCQLFVKLESQNPGGSIKDRMAQSMIEAAETSGVLKPGGLIVEATAGNTGLGLALVAAVKGYRLIIVIPDKMSSEKISHLRAFGADLRLTRSDVSSSHPESYQSVAARIATETKGAWFVNQFANPANPLAHERTTGPEIWEQLEHRVDAVVCGAGSGGTITGLSRCFARISPATELILADPAGSALAQLVNSGTLGPSGSFTVEGIGGGSVPAVADFSRVKQAITVSDADSFHVCRELLRKCGIFAGSSSGTLVAAALEYCRAQSSSKRVITFICDSGNKYLSKMFNDYWMLDQGYIQRPQTGDLRDLITRRYDEGAVITVSPADTLLTAFQRMRMADVSQVPVIEGGKAVGILDESDLLVAVHVKPDRFHESVVTAMTSRVHTLPPDASLDTVLKVLDSGLVPLIASGDAFYGLITRTDVLNYLRRRLP